MAVKWIGDVARELGMDVYDAVELLASRQNYPMNGLLDEDRVQLLKMYRTDRAAMNAASEAVRAEDQPGKKAGAAAAEGAAEEAASVTAPIATLQDRAEDRTVIIPTLQSKR